jgi:hypothetical protein
MTAVERSPRLPSCRETLGIQQVSGVCGKGRHPRHGRPGVRGTAGRRDVARHMGGAGRRLVTDEFSYGRIREDVGRLVQSAAGLDVR